jgi:hypothetical protein
MKPGIDQRDTEEIFAQWPAHFCRVTGAAAGNCATAGEKYAEFKAFCRGDRFILPWHDRC